MPQPYEGGTTIDLSDAPGGDYSLDDLFPPEGAPQTTAPADTPAAPVTPQAPPTEEYFLKTSTGTVYKTREDAIKGIEHKDTLIANYKQPAPEPVNQQQAQPTNYANDPTRLYDDMATAQTRGDKQAWGQLLNKWLQDNLAPFVPAVQHGVIQQAQDQVSSSIPDFRTFRTSNDFKETLESLPVLQQAIGFAEQNVQGAQQLPDLYRLAYLANQGRLAGTIARTAQAAPAPQETRPTLSPGTQTPPPVGAAPDLRTPEGRKAIIDRAKQTGMDQNVWKSLGF